MEQIKTIISDLQQKLVTLGFNDEQIRTILYEIVLIASAKLAEEDLSFLSKEEMDFVSNKDLMQLTPQQLSEITLSSPNLIQYMDIYAKNLKQAITEFDQIIMDVRSEEESASAAPPLE